MSDPSPFRRALLVGTATLLPLALQSCGGDGSTGPDPNAVAQVTVSAGGSTTIPIGGTLQLQASLANAQGDPVTGQSVSWSSQDTDVATVSQSGLVTGVGEGSTTITATAGGQSGQVTVTVVDPNPPDAPSSLAAETISDTRIDLSWSAGSTNEDEFRIERETATSAASAGGPPVAGFEEVATVGAGVTSYSDTGLDPDVTHHYRVRACNDNGCSDYSAEVEAATFATLVIETDTLPLGTVGVAYDATLQASGGDGAPTWSLADGALPPDVSLSDDGELTGTPSEAGVFGFTVEAQGGGQTVQQALEIEVTEQIQDPVVTTTSLPDGIMGEAYSAQLEASLGDGTYEWALTAGSLPPDVSLSTEGLIEGTPTDWGTFTFTVEVTSADLTGDAELSITIGVPPVDITTTELPDGQVDAAYSETLEATGGDGENYAWSVTDGALPPGLDLEGSTGTISGTPDEAGTFDFTVEAESGDETDQQELSIEIAVTPVTITTTSLPDGLAGSAYSEKLEATGGDGTSYSWSVVSGSLPTDLSLDASTGVISGTPSEGGTFDFTVEVESGGETDQQELSITVTVASVAFENWYLPVVIPGEAYSYDLEVSGGDGASYTFTILSGGLPSGISLDSGSGTLSGSSSASGTYFFEVEVESAGSTATRVYALTVSTVGSGGYNIAILNAAGTIPPAGFRSALDDALERWEEVITTNFPPFTMPDDLPDDFCQGHGEKLKEDEVIEDLVIVLDIASIDGSGGTLARAGPCGYSVGDPPLFRAGSLRMDSDDVDDLAADQLLALAIHEIGHVLGFGALWDFESHDLIVDKGDEDPRFTGAEAVAAYHDLGGADDDIPVENTGGSGTRDSHWRETTFEHEIMTGFIEPSGESMPLSAMTIESLEDLTYSVNPAAADPYSLPSGDVATRHEGRSGLQLHDDVVLEPALLLLPDGTVRMLERRR